MTARIFIAKSPPTFKISQPGWSAISAPADKLLFDGFAYGALRPVYVIKTDLEADTSGVVPVVVDVPYKPFSTQYLSYYSLDASEKIIDGAVNFNTGDDLAWTEGMGLQRPNFHLYSTLTGNTIARFGVYATFAIVDIGGEDYLRVTFTAYNDCAVRACLILIDEWIS